MDCVACKPRGRWEWTFVAQPKEVTVVRRRVRALLDDWGLAELVDSAEVCVSELVSNVVTHVGSGTPVGVGVSVVGSRLRIEVRDPDTRALPALVDASDSAEAGRGMSLIDALSERWGIGMEPDGKVTWCELEGQVPSNEREHDALAARTAQTLSCYSNGPLLRSPWRSRLGAMAAEVDAIAVIAGLLQWLSAHGHDADDVLDRAQTRFEAQLNGTGGLL